MSLPGISTFSSAPASAWRGPSPAVTPDSSRSNTAKNVLMETTQPFLILLPRPPASSVHMYGDNVCYRAEHQHVYDRHMQDMPKREQALVGIELGNALDALQIGADQMLGCRKAALGFSVIPALRVGVVPIKLLQFAHSTHIYDAATQPKRGKCPHGSQTIPPGCCEFSLKIGQRTFHSGRKGMPGLNLLRVQPGQFSYLLQAGTASIESMVDTRIDEATDDAAHCDQRHAGQRNSSIVRAYVKTRMREDEQWAQDPQCHVQGKPVFGRSKAMHETEMLAQRVQKQQQHHDAAGQAEVITHTRSSGETTPAPDRPGARNEHRHAQQHRGRADFALTRLGRLVPWRV